MRYFKAMTYADYKLSQKIASEIDDDNYYAIIMAAMRMADSTNLDMLKRCWPAQFHELQARYNAPGGLLNGEALP